MIQNTSHSNQHASMLIELDCILDTRHGTLAKFGTVELTKALTHGYFTRNSDHFYGIDPERFTQLHRERDAVTLSMSVMSHGVSIMKDFVKRVHLVSASSPVSKIPRLDVNIWPYNPPSSLLEKIEKALRVVINDRFDMSFVRYAPKELHYGLIKFTYDHLCMYNVGELIDTQAKDWERQGRGLPDVTVFSPMISHSQNPADVPEDISETMEQISTAMSPLLNIMFLPIHFFCTVANPFDLTEEKPPQSPKAPE